MNKKNLCSIISQNLWSLYDTIAKKISLPMFNESGITGVRSKPSPWPDFIYNTGLEEGENKFKIVNKLVNDGILSPFWITDPYHSFSNYEKLLNDYRFKLIMKWPGMFLKLKHFNIEKRNELSVITLNTIDQLKTWFDLIEQNLFSGKRFDDKYYQLLDEPSLKFFMILHKGKYLGTTLLHLKEDIAGCFMVSISKDFQKRGLASWMMQYIINILYEKGIKYLILQANDNSENMYKKLGFSSIGDFEIYWKISII